MPGGGEFSSGSTRDLRPVDGGQAAVDLVEGVVVRQPDAHQAAALFDADDYQAPADSDRRDLLQKLIDAGREHEYKLANAYQNQFAQKYNKLGLFTDAKQRSDALLSAVEQRFVTHVYSDKICKDASDEEVADALQEHVIDALCKPNGSGPGPSAKAVLQALYFLTEQCYIRWDAP